MGRGPEAVRSILAHDVGARINGIVLYPQNLRELAPDRLAGGGGAGPAAHRGADVT
jgi:hypothetical protein